MNNTQKAKRNFRNSKKWKSFRSQIYKKQNGIDAITHKKLLRYANLHHLDLDEQNYENLSNEENFVFLNKNMHKVVHELWRYYKTDQEILDRLKVVLDKMLEINK